MYHTYYIMHIICNRLDIIYEVNTRVYIREIVYLLQDLFVKRFRATAAPRSIYYYYYLHLWQSTPSSDKHIL